MLPALSSSMASTARFSLRWVRLCALIIAASLVGCPTDCDAQATPPGFTVAYTQPSEFEGQAQLVVVDTSTGQHKSTVLNPGGGGNLSLSRDGRRLVVANGGFLGGVTAYDVASPGFTELGNVNPLSNVGGMSQVKLSGDGTRLLFLEDFPYPEEGTGFELRLAHLPLEGPFTNSAITTVSTDLPRGDNCQGPCGLGGDFPNLSPNGRYVSFIGQLERLGQANVYVWDEDEGHTVHNLVDFGVTPEGFDFDARLRLDPETSVMVANDGTIAGNAQHVQKNLEAFAVPLGGARIVISETARVLDLSDDGHVALLQDSSSPEQTIYTFVRIVGGSVTTPQFVFQHERATQSSWGRLSADGKVAAIVNGDSVETTLHVFNLETGSEISTVPSLPADNFGFLRTILFGGGPPSIVITETEPANPRAGPGPNGCTDVTNARADASQSGLPGTAPSASGAEQGAMPADPNAASGRKSNPTGSDPCDAANCNSACNTTGDPINLFRGSVVEQAVDTSWSIPGGTLVFQRTYNSDLARDGALGPGWSHTFERRIETVAGGAVEIDGRGVRLFHRSAGSAYLPLQDGGARLQQTSEGWTSRFGTGTTYQYLPDGKLDLIRDSNGNVTRAEYFGNGDLHRIIDPRNGVLEFAYSGGHIREITAKDGAKTTFAYDGLGRLAVVAHSATQLTRYQYVSGSDDAVVLSRITQPSGRYVAFTYDANHRVTRLEEHDLAGTPSVTEIAYPSDRVRVFKDPMQRETTYRFDESGNLVQRTDPDGLSVRSQYSAAGRLTRFTDRDGAVTEWAYTPDGHLESHRSPTGLLTRIEQDPVSGAPALLFLPDDGMIQRTYDPQGNLLESVDPVGHRTVTSLDASGLVTSVTDPRGRVVTYEHDANGDIVATTLPDNGRTVLERDILGRVTRVTSPKGRVTQLEYEGVGLVKATIDAGNQRTTKEFDPDGQVTAVTAPNGARTAFEYRLINGRNVVSSITDALSHITRMFHDAAGDLIRIEDPLLRSTSFTRDNLGRITTVTYPDTTTRTLTYTPTGRVASVTNARGATTLFEYDADQRITRTQLPDGTATTLAYDNQGNLSTTTAPDGGTSSRFYDAARRLVMAVDALGSVSRMEYTSSNAIRRLVDRRDKATRFEQDALDRTVEAIDALGNRSRRAYDEDGLLSQTFDARDAETRLTYDAQSRLAESQDPLGNRLRKGYDAVGNCTSVTDQNGRVWTLEYDLLNRLTRRMDPNGRSVTYDYDAASQITQITWEDGSRWSYIRDLMGRVTTRRLLRSDGSEEDRDQFTHDTVGNVLTSENSAVRVTNVFDLMDRVTLRTTLYKATGSSRQQAFSFDSMGRRATMTDTQGRVVTYTYDQLSRLTGLTVVEAQPGAAGIQAAFRTRLYGFTYDRTGNLLEVTYPNGTRTTRVYDDANRMTRLAHERMTEAGVQTLASFDYARDPNGNITQITDDQARIFRYTYDLNGRLTRALLPEALVQKLKQKDQAKANANVAQDPDDEAEEALIAAADVSYTYDPAGNVTLESRDGRAITSTFSPVNEILTRDGITFSHDARGNLVGKTLRNGARRAYAFDTAGRMVSYSRSTKQTPNTLVGIEAYAYDPIGRRATLQTLANQKFTHFLWDGAHLADEWKQVSVTATARNEDGIQYLIDVGGQPLEQYEYRRRKSVTYPDVTGTNSALPPTNLTWLHPDHLGSTTLTTKVDVPSGLKQVYGPFGQELDGTFTSTRYGYAGMQRSSKSGLHYAWHRFYDPDAGRFVSRDPLHFAAGDANLYRYVFNNPANLTDRFGLQAQNPIVYSDGTDPGPQPTLGEALYDWFWGVSPSNPKGDSAIKVAQDIVKDVGNNPVGQMAYHGAAGLNPVTSIPKGIAEWNTGVDVFGHPVPKWAAALGLLPVFGGAFRGTCSLLQTVGKTHWSAGMARHGKQALWFIEGHHPFVREFADDFAKAGLNVEDYIFSITKHFHKYLHDVYGWNDKWATFFAAPVKRSAGDILNQLDTMSKEAVDMYRQYRRTNPGIPQYPVPGLK